MARIDAVIISGARRGEIISVPETLLNEPKTVRYKTKMPVNDVAALNDSLDAMLTALENVRAEVRTTTETLRERDAA